MTRKLEEPETRVLRRTDPNAAETEAPTRWLRIKRGAPNHQPTPSPDPATRAMPQSVLADLFDVEHARLPKHRALCASPTHDVATSTPASLKGRRFLAERSRQTETIVRPIAETHDVNPSTSSGKTQAKGPQPTIFQRLRGVRPARTSALVGTAVIAIISATVLVTHRAPAPSPDAPTQMPTAAVHAGTARQASASRPAAETRSAPALSPARSEITPTTLAAPVRAIPSAAAAIEKLASGDYRSALAAYRDLASAFPEQPAYAAAASVLHRRLATRCKQTAEIGDPACRLK